MNSAAHLIHVKSEDVIELAVCAHQSGRASMFRMVTFRKVAILDLCKHRAERISMLKDGPTARARLFANRQIPISRAVHA